MSKAKASDAKQKELAMIYEDLRVARNLSQKQLADILEVNPKTISFYENGTQPMPSWTAIKYADYFGVTCDYLLRGVPAADMDFHKATGLSGPAIERLKEIKEGKETENGKEVLKYAPEVLSKIIEDENFSTAMGSLNNIFELKLKLNDFYRITAVSGKDKVGRDLKGVAIVGLFLSMANNAMNKAIITAVEDIGKKLFENERGE